MPEGFLCTTGGDPKAFMLREAMLSTHKTTSQGSTDLTFAITISLAAGYKLIVVTVGKLNTP